MLSSNYFDTFHNLLTRLISRKLHLIILTRLNSHRDLRLLAYHHFYWFYLNFNT